MGKEKANLDDRFLGKSINQLIDMLFSCEFSTEKEEILNYICSNFARTPESEYLRSLLFFDDSSVDGDIEERIFASRICARDIKESLDLERIYSLPRIEEIVSQKIAVAKRLAENNCT